MNKINAYFLAEKYESLIFIIVGAVALILSFYFWLAINSRFYNGVGWPLLFISLIQLTVGSIVYLRSPTDAKRVNSFAENNPKNIRALEIPRMEKVMRSFIVYRYVEIALILIGLFLFLWGFEGGFVKGLGLGLVIQAGLILLADAFAENRGHWYLEYLKSNFG